jgi:hypothetical protein
MWKRPVTKCSGARYTERGDVSHATELQPVYRRVRVSFGCGLAIRCARRLDWSVRLSRLRCRPARIGRPRSARDRRARRSGA